MSVKEKETDAWTVHVQEALWAWCDVEEHVPEGGCCFSIGNAGHTSDEYQLRSPPFYAVGVAWTLRLYKAKPGQAQAQVHFIS